MAKTRNHSVRFDEKDFEFICKRESLKTAQQVVSFLLNEYIKLWKVEKKSVFAVEKDVYDSPRLPNNYRDEPKQSIEPEIKKDYNYYYDMIRNLEEQEECFDFISSVKSDQNLAAWQKKLLEDKLKAKWQ